MSERRALLILVEGVNRKCTNKAVEKYLSSAPEVHQQISPGQSDAATAASAALGVEGLKR